MIAAGHSPSTQDDSNYFPVTQRDITVQKNIFLTQASTPLSDVVGGIYLLMAIYLFILDSTHIYVLNCCLQHTLSSVVTFISIPKQKKGTFHYPQDANGWPNFQKE